MSDIVWLNRKSKEELLDWLKAPNGASPKFSGPGPHRVWLEAVEGGGVAIRWSKKL